MLPSQSHPLSSSNANINRLSNPSDSPKLNHTIALTPPGPPPPIPCLRWSKIPHYGDASSPAKHLRAHTMNLIGDKLYVFGGSDAKICSSELSVFDAETLYWSSPKTYGTKPDPCRAHSAVVVDRRLFIFGGKFF